jgi:hypothetical protein
MAAEGNNMTVRISKVSNMVGLGALARRITIATTLAVVFATYAQGGSTYFTPGNLLVSRSVYDNNPNNVTVGQTLPPNCASTGIGCGTPTVTATNDGTYPTVWNNALVDASFGITSKIFLDQLTPSGTLVNSLEVPNSSQNGVPPTKDQMVTSFSSKSEMALNLSTDGNYVTLMGYYSPIDALDVSNSNTPAVVDPTNPVGENDFRVVAQVDAKGKFSFTATNAYSGNNGRAAILNKSNGANVIYTAGNAGNGNTPQPDGVILGAGAQIMDAQVKALVAQKPGSPTPVGSFNITQLKDTADKTGKDTNFRGLTIFNNVIYTTKGSGSNGINSVYFIDTTGSICSSDVGAGLPSSSAVLPTSGIAYDPTVLSTEGVTPYNMCLLNGFNTVLAKKTTNVFPFGIWFANANTLYLADEGDGYAGGLDLDTHAQNQTRAGLQKWIFNSSASTWELAYVLQNNLGLGVPYTVTNYPTGLNPATCVVATGSPNPNNCPVSKTLSPAFSAPYGLPWAPATDGLRNITGAVNSDGTATIYAITSTISGNGDQGADPNKLVLITDELSATSLPTTESFTTIDSAGFGEVLRGVSWTPGSSTNYTSRF